MIRHNPNGGWLEVICGPMFSGKSEEMIRRLRRAEIAGQRVVIFKPRIDDRYDGSDVVSHAGVRMRGVPVAGVAELVERAPGFEVVGIDEIQFFEPRSSAALALADAGRRVVVAGLDQDFRRQAFGVMPDLLAHAEFVDKLQAVCHRCGGRRRRRSGSWTGGRRRTPARRSSSARTSSTKRAAATATRPAKTSQQSPRSSSRRSILARSDQHEEGALIASQLFGLVIAAACVAIAATAASPRNRCRSSTACRGGVHLTRSRIERPEPAGRERL